MKLEQAALCLEPDCQEVFAFFTTVPYALRASGRDGMVRTGTLRTPTCPRCGSSTWHPISRFVERRAA